MLQLLQIYKALADESRLRLLRVLRHGPYNVAELCVIGQMGQSRVSRHLKLLLEAGLCRVKREGTWAYYDASGIKGDDLRSCQLDLLIDQGSELAYADEDESRRQACLEARRAKDLAFHDQVAGDWVSLRDELFGDGAFSERVLDSLGRPEGLADLGCGPGVLLPRLAERAQRVIGIDNSNAMLDQARTTLRGQPDGVTERIELRLGALEHLPLADAEVDAVLINMVLHHLADPPAVLCEVQRVLGPGGRVVVCDLARHDDERMREKYSDQWLGFEQADLERFFEQAGFKLVEITRYDDTPRAGILLAVAQKEENR